MDKPIRVIAAKFGSECIKCGRKISERSLIRWKPSKPGEPVAHLDCEGDQKFVVWRTGQMVWARPLDKECVQELVRLFADAEPESDEEVIALLETEYDESKLPHREITREQKSDAYKTFNTWRAQAREYVAKNNITMEQFTSAVLGVRTVPKPRP